MQKRALRKLNLLLSHLANNSLSNKRILQFGSPNKNLITARIQNALL